MRGNVSGRDCAARPLTTSLRFGRRGKRQVEFRSAVCAGAACRFVFVRLDCFVQTNLVGIVIAIVRWRDGFGIVDDAILREHGLVVAFAAEGAVMAVAEVIVFVDGREEFQGSVCGKCDRDVSVIWNTGTCSVRTTRCRRKRTDSAEAMASGTPQTDVHANITGIARDRFAAVN
jgi:hypothetical protein